MIWRGWYKIHSFNLIKNLINMIVFLIHQTLQNISSKNINKSLLNNHYIIYGKLCLTQCDTWYHFYFAVKTNSIKFRSETINLVYSKKLNLSHSSVRYSSCGFCRRMMLFLIRYPFRRQIFSNSIFKFLFMISLFKVVKSISKRTHLFRDFQWPTSCVV